MILKIRLLALIIASTLILFINNWQEMLLILIALITLSLLLPQKRGLTNRIYPLLFVALLIIAFQLIFNYTISLPQRFIAGLTSALKIFSLSMLVFIYTATTSVTKIADTFSFLPKSLQLMLTITLSLLPVVMDEYHKIYLVQSTRGNRSRFLPIIIPLLHRSLKRAEQIGIVMVTRGYE